MIREFYFLFYQLNQDDNEINFEHSSFSHISRLFFNDNERIEWDYGTKKKIIIILLDAGKI